MAKVTGSCCKQFEDLTAEETKAKVRSQRTRGASTQRPLAGLALAAPVSVSAGVCTHGSAASCPVMAHMVPTSHYSPRVLGSLGPAEGFAELICYMSLHSRS